jgi:excisionase family DNA binding protein
MVSKHNESKGQLPTRNSPRWHHFFDGEQPCSRPAVARLGRETFLCQEHECEMRKWDEEAQSQSRGYGAVFLTSEELAAAAARGWYYTLQEVAAILNRSASTVHKWVGKGKLRATKTRRHWRRITQEDLQAFIEGKPPPPLPIEKETTKKGQSDSSKEQLSAEDVRKLGEAADFIASVARSARHVNRFAEEALKEAEQRSSRKLRVWGRSW